jgi:hypothetical protein
MLKADPSVDLVHFTILRPPHKMDPTPLSELALISFPTRELFIEKLPDFDLVIFDQYERINVLPMTYFNRIARYVEDGGALLVAAGPPYASPASIYRTPLASILPAKPTGNIVESAYNIVRPKLGERHTVTSKLSSPETWGRWERYVEANAPSGEVVLETSSGSPLLVLDRIREGRVAILLSDQLWMWARGFEGGGPYAELVRRTAHWLMKEPELEEERLTLETQDGRVRAELRSLQSAPPILSIVSPNGEIQASKWQEVQPGVFESEVPANELGMYAGQSGELSAAVLNGPANPKEYINVQSTETILAPLSERTNGAIMWLNDLSNPPGIRKVSGNSDTFGESWLGLKNRNAYTVRASEATSLLPPIPCAAIFLLILLFVWRREGR